MKAECSTPGIGMATAGASNTTTGGIETGVDVIIGIGTIIGTGTTGIGINRNKFANVGGLPGPPAEEGTPDFSRRSLFIYLAQGTASPQQSELTGSRFLCYRNFSGGVRRRRLSEVNSVP